MRTVLDDGRSWFLDALMHTDEVSITVAEGMCADEPGDVEVGPITITAHAVEPGDASRRILLRFQRPVACQVVDEAYVAPDGTERRDDDRVLRVLSRSTYLDYVLEHHGWCTDVGGSVRHYQLITELHVVDVIAHADPFITELPGGA